jgi:mannose-1-phosphate guanylyltransferase/mannose-6-phosphate isomerase
MPADHIIQDQAAFLQAVESAVRSAAAGKVVTFGIVPTAPETGYGYIQVKDHAKTADTAHRVHRFVEKPNLETAQGYLDEGGYYWNSGLVVVQAGTWLNALERCRPDILAACRQAYEGRQQDHDFCRPGQGCLRGLPQRLDRLRRARSTRPSGAQHRRSRRHPAGGAMVRCRRLERPLADRREGRKQQRPDGRRPGHRHPRHPGGSANTAWWPASASTTWSSSTPPTPSWSPSKDKIQQVKDIVNQLKHAKRSETHAHRKVYRPWGWYDSIDAGPAFPGQAHRRQPWRQRSACKCTTTAPNTGS